MIHPDVSAPCWHLHAPSKWPSTAAQRLCSTTTTTTTTIFIWLQVRETGALFRFDYRDVYWNSRLSHEHEHIAKEAIAPKSVVADMFCGVGPFAVPLGMVRAACDACGGG